MENELFIPLCAYIYTKLYLVAQLKEASTINTLILRHHLNRISSVIIPVLDLGACIHEFNRRLKTLRNSDVVLHADVPEGRYIVFRCSDPTETLAKRVVSIHDIPVAGRIRNSHGALGPIVIPLRNLYKGQSKQQKTKQAGNHKQ